MVTTPVLNNFEFKTLTMAPIDTRLIDMDILSDEDIKWLNDYNKLVRETLIPVLSLHDLYEASNWLADCTLPISRRV